MLNQGIIEPSTSQWQAPVVLVRKKNAEFRFTLDYRRINSVTVPMSHPLPTMDTVLDFLAEKQPCWFSSIDLINLYFQIPMHPDSKFKTAFCTLSGNYQFTRMPFGLTGAPATAATLINTVLRGLNFNILTAYLDDILIASRPYEDHLNHLSLVFDRLRAANLKLKPSKCTLATQKLLYLGHVFMVCLSIQPKYQLWPLSLPQNPQKK